MSKISITCDWLPTGTDNAEIRDTSGRLSISIDNVPLTRSQDIWSGAVRDDVLVSAYPLALWLASSWWRLLYEPLAHTKGTPATDWRMSHELGAANHGFVWPDVAFATDGKDIQVEARASTPGTQQSIRYLTSQSAPARISALEFESAVAKFIGSVVSRLHDLGHMETELSSLWALVQTDRSNADTAHTRRLEALLGYDQEECPAEILEFARRMEKHFGDEAFSELAPAYGATQSAVTLEALFELEQLPGLMGRPEIDTSIVAADHHGKAAWECAVAAARNLRETMYNKSDPIPDDRLYRFLGLNADSVANWKAPHVTQKVAVAAPVGDGMFAFKPRRRHAIFQRFEFARFIGDLLARKQTGTEWLTSTDSGTWRQKFQRAFAAEFLCPIASLTDRLKGVDAETVIKQAALDFQVSKMTVRYLLANNDLIPHSPLAGDFPYRLSM